MRYKTEDLKPDDVTTVDLAVVQSKVQETFFVTLFFQFFILGTVLGVSYLFFGNLGYFLMFLDRFSTLHYELLNLNNLLPWLGFVMFIFVLLFFHIFFVTSNLNYAFDAFYTDYREPWSLILYWFVLGLAGLPILVLLAIFLRQPVSPLLLWMFFTPLVQNLILGPSMMVWLYYQTNINQVTFFRVPNPSSNRVASVVMLNSWTFIVVTALSVFVMMGEGFFQSTDTFLNYINLFSQNHNPFTLGGIIPTIGYLSFFVLGLGVSYLLVEVGFIPTNNIWYPSPFKERAPVVKKRLRQLLLLYVLASLIVGPLARFPVAEGVVLVNLFLSLASIGSWFMHYVVWEGIEHENLLEQVSMFRAIVRDVGQAHRNEEVGGFSLSKLLLKGLYPSKQELLTKTRTLLVYERKLMVIRLLRTIGMTSEGLVVSSCSLCRSVEVLSLDFPQICVPCLEALEEELQSRKLLNQLEGRQKKGKKQNEENFN